MGLKKGHSGTYKRADGSICYRRSVRVNGRRVEKVFARKVDADRWYSLTRQEAELNGAGLPVKHEDPTLAQFAMTWLEKRKSNGKPLSSWLSDERRLRIFIVPKFGDRLLKEISTREWEHFLDDLVAVDGKSAGSRNRVRSLLTKLYNDAIRIGLVGSNPVRIIPKLKESMEAWDYWQSNEEILTYLEQANKECSAFRAFAYIALNTGARMGEILALRWSDVNLQQRRIRICKVFEVATGSVQERTKSHMARWLGINDPLLDILLQTKKASKFTRPSDHIIITDEGKILDPYATRRTHWRICERAQIKQIRIHDLRHTYASHYVMNGGGIAELQMLLGHSTPQMTQKYAHLAPGFLESKAKVVSFGPISAKVISLAK